MEWSDEYVWAYVEGELSDEEREYVERELAQNPARAAEVATMRQAMSLLRRESRAIAARPRAVMPASVAKIFEAEVLSWYRPPFASEMRAAASDDRGAWFRAELSGGTADIDVRVEQTGLSISWTASFLPREGWTLALKPDNDPAMRTFTLPAAKTGTWTAGPGELGFDPRDVPFEIAWEAC